MIFLHEKSKVYYISSQEHQNGIRKADTINEWSVNNVDFGRKLKTLRKQAGLTQKQLATQLGITKSVVSFYELQTRSPSPDVLAKLSMIFHVSVDYLLGLDNRETIDVSGLSEADVGALRILIASLRTKKTEDA